MPRSINAVNSPLAHDLKTLLGQEFTQVKKFWTISPYDWGVLVTSTGEIIDQGKDCTLIVLIKRSQGEYGYIIFHEKNSGKKNRIIWSQGYPQSVKETYRDGTYTPHKVTRSRMIL